MRLNLLCLLLTLPFYASASNIDDLKSTLATTTSDTAKIGLIVSYKTEIGGNDSILKLLGKAKALTKDNNNYRLYDVWRKRAIILWDNKTDSAEMLLKAAIKEADIQNKPLKVGELYYLMCRLKSRGFEFKKARKYGLEAANYFKKRSAKMLLKTCNIVSRAFYYDGNIDSAKIYFQKALVLAYKLNDSMYLSQQLMNMGVIHDVNGASDSALFYYEKAVAVADRIEDKYISAQTHLNLGTFYQERNSLTNAIEEFQVATALFESTNDYENLANNYENIAATYLSMHNLPSSWEYLKKAQKLIKTHHLAFIEPTHYKSLCSYYSQDDNTDSVIKYSLLAAEEFMTVNRICDASTYYYNYIENLELQHKQQLPTDILAKLDTLDQNCDELTKNTNSFIKARILLRQNKLDQAQELADKAMAFYVKGGYTKSRLETLELQAQIAEAKKEYERAYELLSEAYALKDSVFSTERDRDVNFMELQLQQQENEYLTKEREANLDHIGHQNEIIAAKNKQNIFLVIAIVLTSALLLLTLYSRRKDVQTNHQLREQNDKIEEQYHALLDSERSKDNIMSMVAHDLSSPLRSILGLTQMQLDQENLPDETKHILKMIGSSAEKGIRLTGSLLESVKFNSAESGVAEKFNLYSALHDTIEINSRLAKSKQISLENNTDKSIYLSLPKDNFGRVTDNLISNAIKFSEPNKTIRINSKKMGHKVMIEIADEGQGFSEKDLQRAFMPFQQLSAKPTSGEKSTGLGLFIVKSLVTQMGGQISLVSKKGQGATFTLTFFEG